jgi:hypothetical protein
MNWAFVDGNNTVQNIIAYDGRAVITVPDGQTLTQINLWVKIGQQTDTPNPFAGQ